MGPQPFGCGRTVWLGSRPPTLTFNGAATFRLRKGGTVGWNLNPRSILQWGRNLSVAEGAAWHTDPRSRRPLQWGRNLSVAEGPVAGGAAVWRSSFNGAATFRLRKGKGGTRRRVCGRPSMGPQPFGCGRGNCPTCQGKFPPSFNGAATFRLRKAGQHDRARRRARPSMGPQPFGCGRRRLGRRRRRARRPSMGPQPFGCGRGSSARQGSGRRRPFNGAATFRLRKARPRRRLPLWLFRLQWGRNLSVAEGPDCRACGQAGCHLQWGRNLSVAEGCECDHPADRHEPLQWGRNLSVAEGKTTGRTPPRTLSFNGAATFRLRKEGGGRRPGQRPSTFNGAATFRLRKANATCRRTAGRTTFNGAATFRLRKVPGRPTSRMARSDLQWGRNLSVAEGARRALTGGRPRPFNGAATFRLRKAYDVDMDVEVPSPSMGPQPFGCGRFRTAGEAALNTRLQWGRNLSVAEGRGGRHPL